MKSLILLIMSLCFGLSVHAQDCFFEAFENAIGGTSVLAESDLMDAEYVWFVDGLLTFEGALIEPNNMLPAGTYEFCVNAYNDNDECGYCDMVTLTDIVGPPCYLEYGVNVDGTMVLFGFSDFNFPTYEWSSSTTGELLGIGDNITIDLPPNTEYFNVCMLVTDASGETCEDCYDVLVNTGGGPDPSCAISYDVNPNGLLTFMGTTDLEEAAYEWSSPTTGEILGGGETITIIPPPNITEYTICMLVTDANGETCDICEDILIDNEGGAQDTCWVNFDYEEIEGGVILYGNSSLDNPDYSWAVGFFGETGEVVTIPLGAGTYQVCVDASTSNDFCSYCDEVVLIGIVAPDPSCVLTYDINPNGLLTFTATTDLEEADYEWSSPTTGEILGEGETITIIPPLNITEYTICMLVTDANGDTCEVCEDIPIDNGGGPQDTCWVNFDYEEIEGGVILYGNSSLDNPNYTWDNGFFVETGEVVTLPLDAGTYEVCVDASTSNDFCSYCEEVVLMGIGGGDDCIIYGIMATYLDVGYEYTLTADYDPAFATDPVTIVWTIMNSNTGEVTTYTGDFLDIIFDGPGDYYVTLDMTDADGSNCFYEELLMIEDQGQEGCEIFVSEGDDGVYFFEVQSTPPDFPGYAFSWSVDGVDIFVGEQNAMYQFEEGLHSICVEVWLPNGDYYCDECIDIVVELTSNPTDTLLVWPGDANNDGIANNEDLLNIGIAYGISGVEREEMGTAWQGYMALPWDLYFINEINLAYADCNGDGIIDDDDFEAIDINYGETHGKTEGESEATVDDPAIYIDLPEEELSDGEELVAPLMLGDANIGVEGFYGIAFTLEFNVDILDPNSVQLQLEDSWLGNAAELLSIQKAFPEEGRIEVAITRKNQMNVDGAGPIASMIGIIDNIAGKQNDLTEFTVEVSHIRAIGQDEQEILLNAIAETGYVQGGVAIEALHNEWEVYPNPTQGNLLIDGLTEMAAIEVTDIQGRVVLQTTSNKAIDLNGLDAGVYLLRIATESEIQVEKIIIER